MFSQASPDAQQGHSSHAVSKLALKLTQASPLTKKHLFKDLKGARTSWPHPTKPARRRARRPFGNTPLSCGIKRFCVGGVPAGARLRFQETTWNPH